LTWLNLAANVASILTPIAGFFGFVFYKISIRGRTKKLENYLWSIVIKPRWNSDLGERTVDQLISELHMSADEIMKAAFKSKVISTRLEGGAGSLNSRLKLSHSDLHAANRELSKIAAA
jgi:hypothetical protein